MQYTFLDYRDFYLAPIFLMFIFTFAFVFRGNFVKNKNLRKYFMPALILKIIGSISLGLIYNFHYHGGDTSNYFHDINIIYEIFLTEPLEGIRILFLDRDANYSNTLNMNYLYFLEDPSTFMVVRFGSFFSFFAFGSYMIIAICFAMISFTGVWSLFLCLTKIYPHLIREMAISVFFLPSVFFWGSGLMKDSITLAAIGLSFYSFYNIFIGKRRNIFNIILLLLSLTLLIKVKIYIALCLIPACILYLFLLFNKNIKSKHIRMFIRPFLISAGVISGYYAIAELAEGNEKYNMEKIASTAQATSHYLESISKFQGGSFYSLGEYEPTPAGMIQKLPQAVMVSLFRPFIWESKNLIMLLSALESTFFLYLTLWVIFKLGLKNCYLILKTNPYLQFALLFSISFSFAVGITSGNFGTLVRYKIPMMPFYLSAIFVIKSYYVKKKSNN